MTMPTMLPHSRAETLAWAREVDAGPWASLAVPERITYTSHDWTVDLAAVAALTERVRLWTTIVILPAHDEVAVAKSLASVDVLSDGRLTVGVGVGGREHDYLAIGGSFERRWQRMDEQVARMRRIWAGEPPFDGADPGRAAAGPGRVDAGDRGRDGTEGDRPRRALGRRRRRRVDHGRRPRPHGAVVRPDPRRRGTPPAAPRRRTCRRASGTRSATTPRRSCSGYAYDYMKIMGEGVGDWAAGAVTCFTPDALREAVDNARDAGADEFFLVPDHLGSRRAGPHARRPRRLMDVDGLLEEVAARSGSTTTATRRSATGWTRCGRRPPRRPTSTRSGCSRSRPGPGQPREPAARARVAPHPPGAGGHLGRGAAHPRRDAAQRHDRAEPPAGGRPRQPFAARVGGQRVDPAADDRHATRTTRGSSRRAPRRAPSTSSTPGSRPSTTTNPTTPWSARCSTPSTSRASSTPPRSTCRATTSGCWRPTGTARCEYHRLVLQVLQSECPGRWQLKSPQYGLLLDSVFATYPDARLIVTHRDPVKIAASTFSLLRSLTGTFSDVDHTEYIVNHWPDTLSALLDRAMDARDRIGEDAFFDVAYADVVRDPVAVVGADLRTLRHRVERREGGVLPSLPRRQPAAQVRHAHVLPCRGGRGAGAAGRTLRALLRALRRAQGGRVSTRIQMR